MNFIHGFIDVFKTLMSPEAQKIAGALTGCGLIVVIVVVIVVGLYEFFICKGKCQL